MSAISDTALEQNAIDIIMQKVTIILLKKQEVSFDRLRRLTLLGSKVKNYETYCEIVVLSLIKNLGLDSAFKDEIRSETDAYRIFNALNLNDKTVNNFFVEFIAVLAPEILSALATVLSHLSSKLAYKNKTRFTDERIFRLEEKINEMIAKGEEEDLVEDDVSIIASKAISHPIRRSKTIAFTEYLAGSTSRKNNKNKTNSSSSKTKTDSSKKTRDIPFIEVKRLTLAPHKDRNSETASETTERLARKSKKERKAIPDVDSDPLPNSKDIKAAKFKAKASEDESSVIF